MEGGQAGNACGQAESAYGQAESTYGQAESAYGQAESAYGQPESAYGQAESAYGQAESAHAGWKCGGRTAGQHAGHQPLGTRRMKRQRLLRPRSSALRCALSTSVWLMSMPTARQPETAAARSSSSPSPHLHTAAKVAGSSDSSTNCKEQ